MKTLAIIPSRYSSSRFPGKPLIDIAGKTMIHRVYDQSRKAFEHVCVATDDSRIFDEVSGFGGEVVMTSSEHLSGTDRCYEAYINYTADHRNSNFDLIVNVQGDEPLINPEQLTALEEVFEDKSVYLATMAKPITSYSDLTSHTVPKLVIDKNGFALYFSRSIIPFLRDYPENDWLSNYHFLKHIGLYAYRPDTLREICLMDRSPLEIAESLEQLRWLENGMKIKVVKTSFETISIDTPRDLEKLMAFLSNK